MQNQKGNWIDKEWTMPILSIVGSMSLTVAIGIVLAHYNNQPVFDWHGVTLNAIVSLMNTISKAMLAFTLDECLGQAKWIWLSRQRQPLNDLNLIDQASRGPLGCCKILRRPIARSFISIGAITIILSTAMDPFFQLAIGKREDVTYNESSNAQVSYAKRYCKGSFDDILATSIDAADGNTYTRTKTDADFGMKSAVFSGLSQLDASILHQTRHFCSAGNCTWDTFSSLAVCSACNDLTDRIVTKDKGITVPLAVYLATRNPAAWLTQVTEYQLPNGLRGDGSTLMTAYDTGNSTESISFAAHDTLIWSMTMMNFTGNYQFEAIDPSLLKVSAIECGLWYCVNAYTPAVQNGNFTEIVRPDPSKRNLDSWQPIRGSYNETASPPPNTINYDGLTSSVRRTDLQLDEGFNISQAAVYSISKLMNDTFAVSGTQGINAYLVATENNTYYPTAIQSLYNSYDLEATFASLARSMTNYIRQNDDYGSRKDGKEGIYLILIRVRFWFLALPAILIVLGAIFLAVIIYYTHTSGLEVWTTNALPVVAFGRTIGPVFDTENMRTSVMERKAEKEIVQLMTSNQLHDLLKTSSSRQHSGHERITN